MKILLLNDYGSLVGGSEKSISILRDGLKKLGHEVCLFTSTAMINDAQKIADETCLGAERIHRVLLRTANPWAYFKLKKLLQDFKPDVVHLQIFLTQLSPLILPLLKNIPTLYHVVWYKPICPSGTKQLPDGSICHSLLGKVCLNGGCLSFPVYISSMLQFSRLEKWSDAIDLYVTKSEWMSRILRENNISKPIELAPFRLPAVPKIKVELKQDPTAVFCGRLVATKGADVLIKAFNRVLKKIPNAKLLIAGTGELEKNLKFLIENLGIGSSVQMLGFLDQDELRNKFLGAWVQAVPSTWNEPFGLVALEAMARGTAVVASRSGGLTELIREGENGVLVRPGDEENLASTLIWLFNQRSLCEKMGQKSLKLIQDENMEESYVERMLSLYKSII